MQSNNHRDTRAANQTCTRQLCFTLLTIFCSVGISGCPAPQEGLWLSESVHDFGADECLWTFYVYNPGDGADTFRVASDAPWAKPLTPVGAVGPFGHAAVVVAVDRAQLAKSDTGAELTVTSGRDGSIISWVQVYATEGEPYYLRVRDYWPFAVGRKWIYASHAEDVGGAEGDLTIVESSSLAVTAYQKRLGFDIWTCVYEEMQSKTRKRVFAVFVDEYPVFVEDEEVLEQLPNTRALFDAAFADDLTEFWYKGLFAPVDLDIYTNSSRSSALPLSEIAPMRYNFAASKIHANEFPVPRSTLCLGLLEDPMSFPPHYPRYFFALLAEGIGPLMDPFGGSGILQTVE